MRPEDRDFRIPKRRRTGRPRLERDAVDWRRRNPSFLGYVVRYWIDDDPKYGGLATAWEVDRQVEFAEARVLDAAADPTSGLARDQRSIAKKLAEYLPSGSSVEVVDRDENGCSVHLNWPLSLREGERPRSQDDGGAK